MPPLRVKVPMVLPVPVKPKAPLPFLTTFRVLSKGVTLEATA